MEPFKLDRSQFTAQDAKQADNNLAYWLSRSPAERLAAAWYTTCRVYNIDYKNPPRIDKTVFSMRKLSDAQ